MTRFRAAMIAGALLCSAPPASARNPFGWHEHDGFYLRAAAGAGPLHVSRKTEASGTSTSPLFLGDSSTISGVSALFEISAGATPVERLVVAGTVIVYELPEAELRLTDDTRAPLDSAFDVIIVAPTVDIFPDEGGGFHFGGGVGYADGSAEVATSPGSIGGKGVGLTGSVGYGWWVEDEWSIGGMARGTVAFTGGSHESSGISGSERDVVSALTVAVTGLFH